MVVFAPGLESAVPPWQMNRGGTLQEVDGLWGFTWGAGQAVNKAREELMGWEKPGLGTFLRGSSGIRKGSGMVGEEGWRVILENKQPGTEFHDVKRPFL